MISKRIPSQSAFKGVSSKQWVRFVNSLSDEESQFFLTQSCDNCYYYDGFDQELKHMNCTCNLVHDSILRKAHLYMPTYAHYCVDREECPVEHLLSPNVPPAPRLVCVETNPGPTFVGPYATGKNPITITNMSRRGKKSKNSSSTQVVIRSQAVARPRLQARAPSSRIHRSISGDRGFLMQYVNALQDPWEFGPIELGYGTLIETEKATGYLRSSFVVNADGSFAVMLSPSNYQMVGYNNSGASVGTWGFNSPYNSAGFAGLTAGRITSGGIRIFALFPETSASGVLFAGSLPGVTVAQIATYTPTSLAGLSTSELGIGKRGARATILPIDMSAFNMQQAVVSTSGYPNTALLPYTIPYIAGLGFPAGTVVWYEAVINVEGIPITSNAVGNIGIDADRKSSTASDFFVTPERLMRATQGLLTSTVVMDAAQGLASMISPTAGRLIGSARSAFGSGRNISNMITGRNSTRLGRESSVMIEEMKEDGGTAPRGWLNIR